MLENLLQQQQTLQEGLQQPGYWWMKELWREVLRDVELQIELLTLKQAA